METIYDELKDINSWIKYTPMEGQYYKYKVILFMQLVK